MRIIMGCLLNIMIAVNEPSNRNERRQKVKTGSSRRQK